MTVRDVAALVVIAAIGWLAINQRAGKLKAQGEATVWHQQADSLSDFAAAASSALEAINVQENAVIELARAREASAVARADRLERENRDAAARARRAAATAETAADSVRAVLAADSAGLEVFERYVEAVAFQTSALEERAETAERGAALLREGLAAADSVGASLGRQLEATRAVVEPLERALAARTAEADALQRAAQPGKLLGLFHVEPGPAFVVGAIAGVVTTAVVIERLR